MALMTSVSYTMEHVRMVEIFMEMERSMKNIYIKFHHIYGQHNCAPESSTIRTVFNKVVQCEIKEQKNTVVVVVACKKNVVFLENLKCPLLSVHTLKL